MNASKLFLPMNRQIKSRPTNMTLSEILKGKGPARPIQYKTKPPISRKKVQNVFKSRNQLLQEFLRNHNGPLTLQNSKFLNAQVKLHQKRKEVAGDRRQLVRIKSPTTTKFKAKSPPKSKAKSPPKSKAKSPPKPKAKSPPKPKCNTPRCKALKMKNQKVCDAKIKNGGNFCKRHRKK